MYSREAFCFSWIVIASMQHCWATNANPLVNQLDVSCLGSTTSLDLSTLEYNDGIEVRCGQAVYRLKLKDPKHSKMRLE